jgi:hypothetical protein
MYTIYVTLFIPDLFLLIAYIWYWSTFSSTSQPLDTSQSLRISFLFLSHDTVSSRKMKEWIMEDMWGIKRVLKSQGDVQTKVEIQSKL